ncbi:MAG: flagellar basal body rod protein FlgB [Smithellaceae bacterium]|nr:flagellar basal body rod protein FlgB [Smithellaceae bacterium]
MDILFSKTFDLLSTMLEFRSQRHQIVSSNIANIDTPGHIPKEVIFKKELNKAMTEGKMVSLMRTHERHLKEAGRTADQFIEVTPSGEKVSLDKEMMNLAENQLMHNLSVELLARKFRGLNSVLMEAK